MTGRELPPEVRDALTTLGDLGTTVGRHLVMVGLLIDEDPEEAWKHADFALHLAARVGVVREAAGMAAYRVGKFDVALRELRAARRLTGVLDYLPLMADAERGLGRPHKALELAESKEAGALDVAGRLELLIVASGAKLDLDDPEGARTMLEVGELDAKPTAGSPQARQARARLFYAYAKALEACGSAESREWLVKAAQADVDGSTGAAGLLGMDDNDYTLLDLEDFAAAESATQDEDPAREAGQVPTDQGPGEGRHSAAAGTDHVPEATEPPDRAPASPGTEDRTATGE